jgi:VIT1/CCC1 family predicted Fe2+/Mn2+ transporter
VTVKPVKLASQAIFGGSDGVMSILGPVMFTASRYPRLVFPVALMGAVSAAGSMAAGEHMSEERTDYRAVAVMGAATFAGSVLPAFPYLFTSGIAAICCSAAVCLAVALGVGHLRSWRKHRYAETVAILAFVAGLTVICNLFMPGGAA